MNPFEHGETFVTTDGLETDLDAVVTLFHLFVETLDTMVFVGEFTVT
jgi:CTP synthase (UTP-ammonia lyase)